MTLLSYDRYCDEILVQTDALRATLKGADLAATVPSCPDWTLRQLAVHVGGAHRWVGEIVRGRATEDVPEEKVPGFEGPAADGPKALDAWLAEGRPPPSPRCGRRGRGPRCGAGRGSGARRSGRGA